MRLPRVLADRVAGSPDPEEQTASPSASDSHSTAASTPLGPANPPLHADDIGGLRFNVAQPEGYFFPQVEEFVGRARAALRYYEDRDFRHQQVIHSLQVELDNQTFTAQTLQRQIEVFRVNGSPLVNPDGSYVTESQQAASSDEVDSLRSRVAELESLLRQANDARTQAEEQAQSLQEYVDQQVAAYEELRAWTESAEADLEAAADRATQDQQTIEALLAENEILRNGAPEPASAEPAVDAGRVADAPQVMTGGVEESTSDGFLDLLDEGDGPVHQPLAVVPVDSELPEGVVLPSQAATVSQYPAAAPGAPLTSTPDVPVDVWAPELHGQVTAAPSEDDSDPDSVPTPRLPERD